MNEAGADARDGLAAPLPPAKIEAGTPEFRRTNIAVFFCGFAIFAILYCPQPVLPLFVAEFGVSPAQSSLAVSVTAVVMAVAMLFASSVSEAWGRKVMMLGSLILSSALTLALWIAPTCMRPRPPVPKGKCMVLIDNPLPCDDVVHRALGSSQKFRWAMRPTWPRALPLAVGLPTLIAPLTREQEPFHPAHICEGRPWWES
jgi:MFS family permease